MSIAIPIPICSSPTAPVAPIPVPSLRQSVYEDMACGRLYMVKHVERINDFKTAAATRGTELHEIFAKYISHLVATRRSKDLRRLDNLIRKASEDAREVLLRFRDNHEFDPNKIVGTELEIKLDKDFNPIDEWDEPEHGQDDRVAYRGTLDLVQLHSPVIAEINDWKSYFQIIEADTFQSKLYPLLLFRLNPLLKKVKFVLEFVRYGASRSVEYHRSDVPMLMEIAERERRRQEDLHMLAVSSPDAVEAAPGRHCTWCPLVFHGCPLESRNQYQHQTPQELLGRLIWLRESLKKNTEILKHWALEGGPIEYRDGNGKAYGAAFSPISKTEFPYMPTATIVAQWVEEHPDDKALKNGITVSNLTGLLRAQKRAELRQRLDGVALEKIETRFEIGRLEDDEEPTETQSNVAD